MKYCKRCLQPDTRPGIAFNEDQVCYACLYEQEKQNIDWDGRLSALNEIARQAKEKTKESGGCYDCVIGVSGGKDSTFQAVYAKEKLGLHPLLVNCVPDTLTEVGRQNLDNLAGLGFDIIQIRPDPQIARRLARRSFFEFGNVLKPSEYCLWAAAYIIADKFDIPLIIQGENPALTLGTVKDQSAGDDAFSVVEQNTLRGCNASDWVEDASGDNPAIGEQQLFFYQFPDIERLRKKGIRAIFLQYYAKEWSQVYNADFSAARGLIGRATEDLHDIGRYRRYTALDSDMQIVNQMMKYLKFGFGFATDEACYDIREGRLTREEAVWHVKEYDGKCAARYIQQFCDYISISESDFWREIDKIVNKKLFAKTPSQGGGAGGLSFPREPISTEDRAGGWSPKFSPGTDFD